MSHRQAEVHGPVQDLESRLEALGEDHGEDSSSAQGYPEPLLALGRMRGVLIYIRISLIRSDAGSGTSRLLLMAMPPISTSPA
jgi:hypothetical protein